MNVMKELGTFNTRQTIISVFDTDFEWENNKIYAIKTIGTGEKGKTLVRFGTNSQIKSILNTYVMSVMWVGKDRNELNRLLKEMSRQPDRAAPAGTATGDSKFGGFNL